MKLPKKSLIAGFAAAGVVGLAVVGSASALTSSSSNDSLANRIASKFGLQQSDVQQVIDGYKSDKEAEHEQKFEDRLTQAVTDGKITEDQKTKIIAKVKEVKAKMDDIRNMSDDTARRDAMKTLFTDTEQWAKDNNIPDSLIKMLAHGGPGGHKGMGPDMMDDNQTPSDDSGSSSNSSTN